MSHIILSDRGTFLGKSCKQFRITRMDPLDMLLPAWELKQILVLGSGIFVY